MGMKGPLHTRILAELLTAEHVSLILDYDGTLVPFAPRPSQAPPDRELCDLLGRLAARKDFTVHVVSGRVRADLEAWLGDIAVHLHAEHGLWTRLRGSSAWRSNATLDERWKERVRPILEAYVRATPGSFIEEKAAGLAWHYRMVEHEVGALQAAELRLQLTEVLSNSLLEVLAGDHVLEIRVQGVHKGLVVPCALAAAPDCAVLAIGDDASDEDLFGALPEGAFALKVGSGSTRAAGHLRSPREVRELLEEILSARGVSRLMDSGD